jgi:hypothetical protein
MAYRPIFGIQLGIILACALVSFATADNELNPIIQPETSPYLSEDGTVSFKWDPQSSHSTYLLERSNTPDFSDAISVYEGGDLGTFVSGLTSGVWYFRLSSINSEGETITNPVEIEVHVEFVNQRMVWLLMGSGCLTFVILLVSITRGNNQYQTGKDRKELS